jgi:hypothetical protein
MSPRAGEEGGYGGSPRRMGRAPETVGSSRSPGPSVRPLGSNPSAVSRLHRGLVVAVQRNRACQAMGQDMLAGALVIEQQLVYRDIPADMLVPAVSAPASKPVKTIKKAAKKAR